MKVHPSIYHHSFVFSVWLWLAAQCCAVWEINFITTFSDCQPFGLGASVTLWTTGHFRKPFSQSGMSSIKFWYLWAAPVVQRFSAACSPGCDLETRDGVPHWAPCMEPASPSVCVSASLFVPQELKKNGVGSYGVLPSWTKLLLQKFGILLHRFVSSVD